jgi:anti-anti-sigma factor
VPAPQLSATIALSSGGDSLTQPPAFVVRVSSREHDRLVSVSGELDPATCDALQHACTDGDDRDVVVDMHEVTFMDSRGYESVVLARAFVEARGHSLALLGMEGQPRHLVELFVAAATSVRPRHHVRSIRGRPDVLEQGAVGTS